MSTRSTNSSMSMVRLASGSIGRQLLGLDDHVAAAAEVVALDDVVVVDLLAVDRADPLLLIRAAIGVVQLVEADVLRRGRRDQLDRHVDQPEADRSAPDCSGHGAIVPHRSPPNTSTVTPGWNHEGMPAPTIEDAAARLAALLTYRGRRSRRPGAPAISSSNPISSCTPSRGPVHRRTCGPSTGARRWWPTPAACRCR